MEEASFIMDPADPWDDIMKLNYERENLGFYFSGHPLDSYREHWDNTVTMDVSRAKSASTSRPHYLLGLLKGLREIPTRRGRLMAFATLEDFNGSIELVFFADCYEQCRSMILDETIVGLQGKVDTSRDRVQFIVESVVKPEELPVKDSGVIHIRIADAHPSEEDLYHLRAFLFERPGKCSVLLHINGGESDEVVVKASEQLMVSSLPETLGEIGDHPQVAEVWKE
jgi:DNA polymerase-3 subunit alpha